MSGEKRIVTVTTKARQVAPATALRSARRRRPRKQAPVGARSQRISPQGKEYAATYLATLNDPFEYPPIKLGYDCFVETSLTTAYRRNSFVVNADGSFAMFMFPNVAGGMVYLNTSGAAGTTWTTQDAANSTFIATNASIGRVISGGLRCFALYPETSAPGVLFAGTTAVNTKANMITTSPNSFTTLMSSELGLGSRGATALIRPHDNGSFEFHYGIVAATGLASNVYAPFSIPYIVGTGWPAGTVIWFEAILNLETIQSFAGQTGIDVNSINHGPTASTYFPSPESLFEAIKGGISHGAIMNSVVDAAAGLLPGALGLGLRAVRSFIGSGSHVRKTLLSGGNSIGQSVAMERSYVERESSSSRRSS